MNTRPTIYQTAQSGDKLRPRRRPGASRNQPAPDHRSHQGRAVFPRLSTLPGPAQQQRRDSPTRTTSPPSFGVAYTPRFAKSIFGNDDTVIRAGFRVGYDDIFNNIPANMGLNVPLTWAPPRRRASRSRASSSYATGFNQNVPLVKFNAAGQPLVGLVGIQRRRSQHPQRLCVSIQRWASSESSARTSRSKWITRAAPATNSASIVDYNQPHSDREQSGLRGNQAPNVQIYPYPTFGSISVGKDIGNSNYNGMVAVTRSTSPRTAISCRPPIPAAIRSTTTRRSSAPRASRASLPTATNINLDRGNSSFDTRQRAVVVYNMNVPIGPGHRLVRSRTTSSTANSSADGRPPASSARKPASRSPSTTRRPISAASTKPPTAPMSWAPVPLPTNYSNPDAAFNTAYFSAVPPTGRVGTSGRNALLRPGALQLGCHGSEDLRGLGRADQAHLPRGLLQSDEPHQLRQPGPQRGQRFHVRQDHLDRRQRGGDLGGHHGRSGRWPPPDPTRPTPYVLMEG